jgi:hypothetical protein
MSDEMAITVREPHYLMPAMALADAIQRRNLVVQFVGAMMEEGRDFGKIPGSDKPTLLKPGAEKLTTFFGLAPKFEIVEKIEDWTGDAHNGEPFFYYLFRCSLTRDGRFVAEGLGSCNSWETKYRYRQGERKCPTCGKATIIKGKQEYGGGWLCFGKKGGCGAKFRAGDQAIEGQQTGRVLNPDPADIANTINKMAQKRSYIAATLPAVNASEFFTQDMEDIIDAEVTPVPPTPEPARPEPRRQAPAPQQAPVPHDTMPPGFDDEFDAAEATAKSAPAHPTSFPGLKPMAAAPAAPTPDDPPKHVSIKSMLFGKYAESLGREMPQQYQKEGKANLWQVQESARLLGYAEITDSNIEAVFAALRAKAK